MSSKPRPPHLAHVVLGLPFGGTEILVERMLRNPPRGYRVTCFCFDHIGEVGERLRRDGVEVVLLGRRSGFDIGLAWRIAREARRRGVDILHCHQYTPFFYGALARLLSPRLRLVFTEHGRFYPDIPSPKRRIFNRLMQGRADFITAVSPAVKDALVQVEGFSPGRVDVVFNGIAFTPPTESKTSLRTRLGLEAEAFHVILCCRFDPIKWLPGLIDAFARVKAAQPGARLILVGDGPEKEAVLAKRKAHGLESTVLLPGFQKNIAEWLAASDAFVLCSLNEGTSVSLIESMAARLPSVVTRVGGNPFVVVDRETGLHVPKEDAAALADGLVALIADPAASRAMGEKARIRYEQHFLPASMDAAYARMYAQALSSLQGSTTALPASSPG